MKRVVVLGGSGQFGSTIVRELTRLGIAPLVAARRVPAEIQIDANDPASLRAGLVAGDVVIDAAGPFHSRSMALVEAAVETGLDVIDINDDIGYAERVIALAPAISAAGIRVLTSSSSVSAVAAAAVHRSGIAEPVRVSGFIAPASRHTANRGSALSLLRSVGRPVRVLRDGRLQTLDGWGQSRPFPMPEPVGRIRGWLVESADAVHLPRIWPSLEVVAMYVDTNTPGLNALLRLGARSPAIRRLIERQIGLGTWISRIFGSAAGGLGYEIADANGRVVRIALLSGEDSFTIAVAPAVLATQAIVRGTFSETGLIPADRHVEPAILMEYFASIGIRVEVQLN